ncbi:hypothetical protein H9Y05_15775 [Crocinitomicaceae bacterium CZZ-1]|uniref:Uncharacterized protein n=1 Tax=Taishania pollutisoli TaxID=2766479 RepID=A0A8J6PBD7_9FLAO|nr:hypothetical protein [Taishania pollutisoli]MBC9813936.1 hypothetical protein [Taishania pollutisoli]
MNTKEFYQLLIDNDGLLMGFTFDKYVSIDFSQFETHRFNYLEFTNCNFKNSFTIDNFNSHLLIEFRNTTINRLNVLRSSFAKLLIDDCNIEKIDLYKLEVVDSISINCKTNDCIHSEQLKTPSFDINNTLSECKCIKLNNPEVGSIIINAKKVVKKLQINDVKNLSC